MSKKIYTVKYPFDGFEEGRSFEAGEVIELDDKRASVINARIEAARGYMPLVASPKAKLTEVKPPASESPVDDEKDVSADELPADNTEDAPADGPKRKRKATLTLNEGPGESGKED